jgi:signal transduction histidine kinase/ligand-binding sensor domain-containing protein/DNA-binding response OmpR family regulator
MAQKTIAIVLFLFFAVANCNVFGQAEQFKFKRLDLKDGLSHPAVWTIYKDSRGFVWFGTGVGLNRFDGYSIRSFLNEPDDTTSLPADGIARIMEAPDRRLVIQTNAGLALYDPMNETFLRNMKPFFSKYGTSDELFKIVRDNDGSFWFVEPHRLVRHRPGEKGSVIVQHSATDASSISEAEITDFHIGPTGSHWLVHSNAVAEKIEVTNQGVRVVQRVVSLHERMKEIKTQYQLISDMDGDLWFCPPSISQGVFLYRIGENRIEHISDQTNELRLNTSAVSGLIEDDNGIIWIGTDHGGMNIVDKKKRTVRYILQREGDITSLAANSISYTYKDDQGIIWIGAYKRGVTYYHPDVYKFEVYKHYSIDPHSLPFEDVNRFEEDSKGNLWIGTNGGGLLYFDRAGGTFKQYLNDPRNVNSLSANVIVSLCRDENDDLWIGTYRGGLNKFDGRKFTRIRHIPGDSTSLPSDNVWEIFRDSKGRLWIGTLDAGAATFDPRTGKFQKVRSWWPSGLQSNTIVSITEDSKGRMWFGTTNGVDLLAEDGKTFTHYGKSSSPNSLSSNDVLDVTQDSKGRIWVASSKGLNLFDESLNGFRIIKESRKPGMVLTVQEDNSGHIWLSTMNGLVRMAMKNGSLDSVSFRRYTEVDGLQGRQFNLNAAFKTSRGEVVFGGPGGFNISKGIEDKEDFPVSKVIFSDLELFENPVRIGEEVDGVVILPVSISEAKEITLPPNKNFFSVRFSALNYFNAERDRFVYKLEGLSTNWLPVDSRSNEIVFNSLNPGKYVLRVRVLGADGMREEKEAKLAIVVKPPFWKTEAALVMYVIIVIGVLILARRVIYQREQMKFAIEQERREMQRIHEMDVMKVKFFTNVSHEFRTPLTLILTPIERLIRRTKDPDQLNQFQIIQRNGKRLMNLVNQLLDFKKMEVHELKFNPSGGDIVAFVKDTVASFSDLSEKKNIRLQFYTTIDRLETLFDHDKVEKILFNLLSNAFKFTLENGLVSVKMDHLLEGNERLVQIEVADTGIGIGQDKLDKIFEPFFQNDLPKSVVNQGSGIGLAITKEFVRIHGGRVEVTSEVGKGSCFRVLLPLREVPIEKTAHQLQDVTVPDAVAEEPRTALANDPFESQEKPSAKAKQKSLLLVEDNDDFRFYLRDNLKFLYNIYEARNGIEGWNLVLSAQPDLIVSDIMMPEMNGMELCSKIKGDERVSHIPVILLTARSSEEQRIEGIKTGADDYITKPFNFEVLEARINNLVSQREKFQKTFRKTLDVKASELQITPLDVKFIENAVKVVEQNISSPTFSIEDLGMELGISRAYVFKKILALTGKTPLEFIRSIRLQHAAQLLEKSQLSVREIAYKVGFNTPKYFTKYFKEQYNVLPSDYAAEKRKEEKE